MPTPARPLTSFDYFLYFEHASRYGSQFMRFLCALADEDGVDFYLETHGARNATYYQKFGFEPVCEYELKVDMF